MSLTGKDKSAHSKRSKMSIRRSLMIYFLLLTILPLVAVSLFTYLLSKETLKTQTAEKLKYSSELMTGYLENWFDRRFKDVARQASSSDNLNLLNALVVGFNDSDRSLKEYITSDDWNHRVEGRDQNLKNLLTYYDFIYDVFLVDLDGNILYSVAKEDDLGTNLFSGKYANTNFAKSIQRLFDQRETQFSDIEFYAPSNNILSGFLSAPIKDGMGIIQGAFAMQFRVEPIEELFTNQQSMQMRYYLIGEDGLLRTSLAGNGNDILLTRVESEQFFKQGDIGQKRYYSNSDVAEYTDPSGAVVFGLIRNVQVYGINWRLISEIDKSAALALSNWLGQFTFLAVVLMCVLAIVFAVLLSKRITAPIKGLAEATSNLASGQSAKKVEVLQNNEIGQLAESFNAMLEAKEKHEHKLVKALLELNQQKFALDQHSIVAMTDIRGTITFVNDKFTEISGYSRDELLGQNHRILNSGLHDHEFWQNMFRTISRGNVWKGEIRNRSKEGQFYWVDTTIVPFVENDKPTRYVAIRTDITKRKLHEMELVDARNKAEEGARAKSEFLATMSHEIRTPMNGVLGMLGILLRTELTNEQRHQAKIVKQSADSLLAIINDILDFSKVEAGKLDLEYLDFDLVTMLSDFSEAIAVKAQEKNIELIMDVKGIEQSHVKGDPGRLRQILSNLVGNAIKFTHKGEILIRATLTKQNDNNLLFHCAIEDTGIGIDDEKVNLLFDPFTQVDASTSRNYGGTGLGLAIVKQLCELMGGDIKVTSEPGKGSCFEFSVQLKQSASAKKVVPIIDMSEVDILIVDDNATNRDVLKNQLEHWGAKVTSAESGKATLQILEQRHAEGLPMFKVAFLDMQMPEMDGAILGKNIHRDSRFSEMKMVMMTSMAMRGDAQFFADIGFSAYFPKPATRSDLFHALVVVLSDGEVLENASPLVTHHYLQELNFDDAEEVSQEADTMFEHARVLVVEDNPVNQLIARTLIEQNNLNCDLAGNGIEAISTLKNAPDDLPFNLVLMDCQMPEMDGYEATKHIREGEAGEYYRDIPIIALTANAMKGDKDKCLKAGMDDYLSKPIDNVELANLIKRWLLKEKSEHQFSSSESENQKGLWKKEDLLKRMQGNEQVVIALIQAFIDDATTQLSCMVDALANNDLELIKITAHSIKGASGNVAAYRLAEKASELEVSLKDNHTADLKEKIEALQQEYRSVEQAMKAVL